LGGGNNKTQGGGYSDGTRKKGPGPNASPHSSTSKEKKEKKKKKPRKARKKPETKDEKHRKTAGKHQNQNH